MNVQRHRGSPVRLSVSDDLEGEIMLGLPKSTELNKPLPKTAIYTKFQMNAAEKVQN